MSLKIGNFIRVSSRPTVVRLEHLAEKGAQWISASYYLTEKAQEYLRCLLNLLAKSQGAGFFLIGHYGSGKSHFLAYLTQALKAGQLLGERLNNPPQVFPISLLNFKACRSLESIVEQALGVGSGQRRLETWNSLSERFPQGVFLLLDELSEFLKSVVDERKFNEDIRFLQFLGEWGQNQKLWVMGAMQEKIEQTGSIDGDLYRKIRDRYPYRFFLTPAHVKDLLSKQIIERKDGFADQMEKLVDSTKEAFPGYPIDYEAFCSLYPLHPVTLELLAEVRDQFSQSRGVVEFVLTQMQGDSARDIAPFLERPWGELIGPDSIVTHFKDLFELQPEYVPLVRQVIPVWQQDVTRLFPKVKQQQLAWKLLNLLILVHLSPKRSGLTIRDASYWLLQKVISIDPQQSEQIISSILQRLTIDSSFVKQSQEKYHLNLDDESSEHLERVLETAVKKLCHNEELVFHNLTTLLHSAKFNPFELAENSWQTKNIIWHHHLRTMRLFLGGGKVTNQSKDSEIVLQIGLPWGVAAVGGDSIFTLLPNVLAVSEEMIELAALVHILERPLPPPLLERARSRIYQRKNLFFKEVQQSYQFSTLLFPSGQVKKLTAHKNFEQMSELIEHVGRLLLQQTFPQFENYAPTTGPLPKQAYRQLMDYLKNHDLQDAEHPANIEQIIEGYLVPLGLMKRNGRRLVMVSRLEKHDLVSKIHFMLPNHPSVQAIFDVFRSPILGMVDEQINLLLIFLLIKGEIDILKGKHSYRKSYQEYPNVKGYNQIIPGKGLDYTQLQKLEKICDGLNIKYTEQWTVSAQHQVGRKLAVFAREQKEILARFSIKLDHLMVDDSDEEQAAEKDRLREKIEALINIWMIWERCLEAENPLNSLEQFLYEIENPIEFLSRHHDLQTLGRRIEQLSNERSRLLHLIKHPFLRETFKELAKVPSITSPQNVENWIQEVKAAYLDYTNSYCQQHERYWKDLATHPIWDYRAPQVASCRHLGLENSLDKLEQLRESAESKRCRELGNLNFQPQCHCGFDGEKTVMQELLVEFAEHRSSVEKELKRFFQKKEVQDKVKSWAAVAPAESANLLPYLQGKEKFPEILGQLNLFDEHLSGLSTFKEIDLKNSFSFLLDQVWDRNSLLLQIEKKIAHLPSRIRFSGYDLDNSEKQEKLYYWALEQAVRTGKTLPKVFFSTDEQKKLAQWLQQEWVTTETFSRLEYIGMGVEAENKILFWISKGELEVSLKSKPSKLVSITLHFCQRWKAKQVADLRCWSQLLYQHHNRFFKLFGNSWMDFLQDFTSDKLIDYPENLFQILEKEGSYQWVVVDGLGLPLLDDFLENIPANLPHWRVEEVTYGSRQNSTDTQTFWEELVDMLPGKTLTKIDILDKLIHSHSNFEELRVISMAELKLSFIKIAKNLSPDLPVLIFSDHGFRFAQDGKSFVHGQQDLLEKIVPLVKLQPLC